MVALSVTMTGGLQIQRVVSSQQKSADLCSMHSLHVLRVRAFWLNPTKLTDKRNYK